MLERLKYLYLCLDTLHGPEGLDSAVKVVASSIADSGVSVEREGWEGESNDKGGSHLLT